VLCWLALGLLQLRAGIRRVTRAAQSLTIGATET
jgi:hypothetical protein